MLEDRLKRFEIEKQQFPQEILAKLKEMDDHLNGIIDKNKQLFELVQFLSDERQTLRNEIEILRQLCVDHDEMARKYLHAKKFHQELIYQKNHLTIELNAYKRIEQNPMANKHQRKAFSFKSIALAVIAIMRMKIILQKMQIKEN